MTIIVTKPPKFKKDDLVTITANGKRGAVWEVRAILTPTETHPQWGYELGQDHEKKRGTRTVDEDRLTLAGEGQ